LGLNTELKCWDSSLESHDRLRRLWRIRYCQSFEEGKLYQQTLEKYYFEIKNAKTGRGFTWKDGAVPQKGDLYMLIERSENGNCTFMVMQKGLGIDSGLMVVIPEGSQICEMIREVEIEEDISLLSE